MSKELLRTATWKKEARRRCKKGLVALQDHRVLPGCGGMQQGKAKPSCN